MTSADPFTKASPHFINAQRGAGRTGSAFETTKGRVFNLGALFGAFRGVVVFFRGRRRVL